MPKRIDSIKPREDFRSTRKKESSRVWYLSLFGRLVFMAVLISIAVNVRIYYNQKADSLNREVARVENQIHEIDREIENLKKRKEQLCSFQNISRRNESCRLGLRHADPRQIRRTALIRRSGGHEFVQISETGRVTQGVQTASIR